MYIRLCPCIGIGTGAKCETTLTHVCSSTIYASTHGMPMQLCMYIYIACQIAVFGHEREERFCYSKVLSLSLSQPHGSTMQPGQVRQHTVIQPWLVVVPRNTMSARASSGFHTTDRSVPWQQSRFGQRPTLFHYPSPTVKLIRPTEQLVGVGMPRQQPGPTWEGMLTWTA